MSSGSLIVNEPIHLRTNNKYYNRTEALNGMADDAQWRSTGQYESGPRRIDRQTEATIQENRKKKIKEFRGILGWTVQLNLGGILYAIQIPPFFVFAKPQTRLFHLITSSGVQWEDE